MWRDVALRSRHSAGGRFGWGSYPPVVVVGGAGGQRVHPVVGDLTDGRRRSSRSGFHPWGACVPTCGTALDREWIVLETQRAFSSTGRARANKQDTTSRSKAHQTAGGPERCGSRWPRTQAPGRRARESRVLFALRACAGWEGGGEGESAVRPHRRPQRPAVASALRVPLTRLRWPSPPSGLTHPAGAISRRHGEKPSARQKNIKCEVTRVVCERLHTANVFMAHHHWNHFHDMLSSSLRTDSVQRLKTNYAT